MTRLSDQIRQAIDDSELTRYRIGKDADIDQASLCKFVQGERGLSLDAIDRLGEVLGLTITTTK